MSNSWDTQSQFCSFTYISVGTGSDGMDVAQVCAAGWLSVCISAHSLLDSAVALPLFFFCPALHMLGFTLHFLHLHLTVTYANYISFAGATQSLNQTPESPLIPPLSHTQT